MKFLTLFFFSAFISPLMAESDFTESVEYNACQNALTQGDYLHAKTVCEDTLKKVSTKPLAELKIYLNLISIYQHLQNSQQQFYYIEKAKNHAEFIKNIASQYEWHRKVGQKFYFAADYNSSKTHLLTAYKIAEIENNQQWLSKSHNDLGLVELKLGNYKNALKHYQTSLKLKQQFGDDYQIAKTLNNLGLTHLYLEQPNEATKYYKSALTHYLDYTHQKKFDERVYTDIAHIYEDLTKAYGAANNSEKADYYAQAIINSLDYKTNQSDQLRALINLSQWHWDKQNFEVLQKLLTAADVLIDRQSHPELITNLRLLQAKLHHQNGHLKAALVAIKTGIIASEKLPDPSLKADLLYLKAQLLEDSDPKQALHTFQEYQKIRSDFLKQKYDSDLKTVQHQIETHKIEQQLLNQELANSKQQHKLQQLTNLILIASLILFIMSALWVFYHFKRKKEKDALMQSIRYHKQQLLILETSHKVSVETSSQAHKDQLKKALVETLIDALTIWEKTTQTSHIELAEQSKIWTVSIDNGTLRTRSLEKYLSLDKIPQNPRWRNVVQTGHFILSQDNLSSEDRQIMEQHLDHIMDQVRALSLHG